VADDTLTWADGYGPGLDFSWQVQTARLLKLLTINAPSDLPVVDQFILDGGNPVLELNLIFAFSSGVTPYVNGQAWGQGPNAGDRDTQSLVEFRDEEGSILWWVNLPRSWDSEANEQLGMFRFKKQGNSLFVTHRVPLSFVQGAMYPLMVDTTIDELVGSDDDDANEGGDGAQFSSTLYDVTSNTLTSARRNHGALFKTVAIGNADTIDIATLAMMVLNPAFNDVNADYHAEDVDSAVDFVTTADVNDRVRTTATAEWVEDDLSNSVFNTSPEFKALVQEVVDLPGWATGQNICVLGIAKSDVNKNCSLNDYGSDTAKAAKLHVEFTAAGVTTRRYSLPITGIG
jgi:hypothetical protein